MDTYDPNINYAEKVEALTDRHIRRSTTPHPQLQDRRFDNCKAGQVPCIGVTPCKHLALDEEHQCNHVLEFAGDGAHLSVRCQLEFDHDNIEYPSRRWLHRAGVVLWEGKNAQHLRYSNLMLTTEQFEEE
jgi:hypothetical protein